MNESEVLEGIECWNGLTEQMRLYWLNVAGTAVPADARAAYLASVSPQPHEK